MFLLCIVSLLFFFFFKQKTAYEMRISDWSSDVCSSDLDRLQLASRRAAGEERHPDRHDDEHHRHQREEGLVAGKVPGTDERAGHAGGGLGRRAADPGELHHHGIEEVGEGRSEEHTSELQSLMRISYAVFCLKTKTKHKKEQNNKK